MKINQQAGPGVRDEVESFEEMLDVGGEVERVRDNDDIEAAVAEVDEFAGLHKKLGLRGAAARGGDLGGGEV